MTATLTRMPTSGQARINAKRNRRAEYWRSVKLSVSHDAEPYFLLSLHLLGDGARIQGRTVQHHGFVVDYDVHLPGVPANAERAEPVFKSVFNGEYYEAQLDYVVFRDVDGEVIDIEAGQ